tara:strand:+ start:280 stop:612 length:333 start_codon:yes stop_codon:yes gene_type:complete
MALYGDNACWAWVHWVHSTSIQSDYNISSISHIGTGRYTVNIDNNASNSNYCVVANSEWDSSGSHRMALCGRTADGDHGTGSFGIRHHNPNSSASFNGSTGLYAVVFATY